MGKRIFLSPMPQMEFQERIIGIAVFHTGEASAPELPIFPLVAAAYLPLPVNGGSYG
jgi:hypothetical protein